MTKLDELSKTFLAALEGQFCLARAIDGDLSKCEVDGGLFDMRAVTRAVLTCLLDDPTMSRDTRRYLEALLKGTPNGHYGMPDPVLQEAMDALSAQASMVAELEAEVVRLKEAAQELNQWANAYPVNVFKEPDLDKVKAILAEAGELAQMDRMHASWARDILSRVREVTDVAIGREDGEGG